MRGLDILKLQLFVLHNTDTISFPLFSSRFLRIINHNKQHKQKKFGNVEISPGPERQGSRETKGIMVTVGWAWQEQGGYEVVGHLPDYRMTCFRKLSDEI